MSSQLYYVSLLDASEKQIAIICDILGKQKYKWTGGRIMNQSSFDRVRQHHPIYICVNAFKKRLTYVPLASWFIEEEHVIVSAKNFIAKYNLEELI